MKLSFTLNGREVTVEADPRRRLSAVLREDLGERSVKSGCDAGDCGACTVLVDDRAVCSCMMASGQAAGRRVETVSALTLAEGMPGALQRSFLHHGAAQCGICTPGMLMAAEALLRRQPRPDERAVRDALGGVLCRCTGYRKIIAAVMDAHRFTDNGTTETGDAAAPVGAPLPRIDGVPKVLGSEVFGADIGDAGDLHIRVIRSPHARARFTFGDLEAFRQSLGAELILTAKDVPGRNLFGVIPPFADQPVFAEGQTRFRGEAVAAVVAASEVLENFDVDAFPVSWQELPAVSSPDEALNGDAPLLHEGRVGNVMARGRVRRGDADAALAAARHVAEGRFSTGFIEHAYIEPEAGYAVRRGDVLELHVCTQAPYMNRDDLAAILGVGADQVRVIATAVGGGFGSKLDLSVHPFLALAAWRLNRPVRMAYSRGESMASTTKRHPSEIALRIGTDAHGRLAGMVFDGIFNTGAYASWGPTVANRVPVHASGPYHIPNYRAETVAVHTNNPPAGAFRGFGVPQSAIAQECLFDELADMVGIDRLEFRILNALDNGMETVTGQVFTQGVGIRRCLEALRPRWRKALAAAAAANADGQSSIRRGVGVAGLWYGCGNTSLPNPSAMRVCLRADGRIVLFQGAVDIGQGANTVITQICAQALGLPVTAFELIGPDTARTPDAGKTSASRQTFISGKAAMLAGEKLRTKLLRLANVSAAAVLALESGRLIACEGGERHEIDLTALKADEDGFVAEASASYDPPTSPLDENGQGEPYACFGYGAHLVELEVDRDLGTVRLLGIAAAHDVGRAINPLLVAGQIDGGIAQGIGLALMEEYLPGRTENLHDYLIPTIGDVPPIEPLLIEEADAHGPYGAKGLGEHVLIATAPAILNAIRHATGARLRHLPATPDRVRAAIREAEATP